MALARVVMRQAALRLATPAALRLGNFSPLAPLAKRSFASASASKVVKVLESELKHEEEHYEQDKEIANFLKSSPFNFVDKDGDVNMKLERVMGDKTVAIEFQLSSPFDADMDEEGGEAAASTEFSVSVDGKDGAGVTFYCSTQAGEDHRYVIGNVRSYSSLEEKEGVTGYTGPEFEDLDDKLQEAFDEHLGELGVSPEVCDFLDAMASDKEQREYSRWLKLTKKFLE
eukprot:TRINITY_DN2212_c0_g1_i1.p1 TRINITY_DN2212_c0_g1~~TRINITY_DN2212_c0_g1_i1.p1  ORF type:complete len:252 (+),score=85.85 TRINITY_DN2212_c0_g1_i1:74-757(+)